MRLAVMETESSPSMRRASTSSNNNSQGNNTRREVLQRGMRERNLELQVRFDNIFNLSCIFSSILSLNVSFQLEKAKHDKEKAIKLIVEIVGKVGIVF